MDDEPFQGPADAATVLVAGQDFLAAAAEAGAGAAAAPVAGPTPAAVKQLEAAAGAAERDLGVGSLKDSDAIEAAVRNILPQLTKLSAKGQLIIMVGHQEGAGHKLVPESTAHRFEEDWRGEVRSATNDSLAAEDDLLRTLFVAKRDSGPTEPALDVPDSPSVTLALLRSARSEVRSQALGSRAVRRSPRLQWDLLVDLYGGEDTLRGRVEKLKASQLSGTDDILELVDRYLGGGALVTSTKTKYRGSFYQALGILSS